MRYSLLLVFFCSVLISACGATGDDPPPDNGPEPVPENGNGSGGGNGNGNGGGDNGNGNGGGDNGNGNGGGDNGNGNGGGDNGNGNGGGDNGNGNGGGDNGNGNGGGDNGNGNGGGDTGNGNGGGDNGNGNGGGDNGNGNGSGDNGNGNGNGGGDNGNGNGGGSIDAPFPLAVSGISSSAIILSWDSVAEADRYDIYYANEPIVDIDAIMSLDGGEWLQDVSSPENISGLSNGQTYYFVVTALSNGDESEPSNQINAAPAGSISGRQPTNPEVRMLELVNRARFDPEAEVARNSEVGSLNEGTSCTISTAQKQPLAFNQLLLFAAVDHSDWMLDTDTFSHTGEGGSVPGDRVTAAGYNWNLVGENIAVAGNSNPSLLNIDDQHDGLFASPGHRCNIMHAGYRELGIGRVLGEFTFTNQDGEPVPLPSSMVTQNYARSSAGGFFITGVVYNDSNSNNIYDIGEGLSGAVVTIDGTAHRTYTSGVYSVPVSNNAAYGVIAAGGSISEPVYTEVQISGGNVKVDAVVHGGATTLVSW